MTPEYLYASLYAAPPIRLSAEPHTKSPRYCRHTGWWVRLLQPDEKCPDCGLHLPPEYRSR